MTSDKTYKNNPFRDFDVHLHIEDDERNYLLKIGTVFERVNGQLSGETCHGHLILTPHGCPLPDRSAEIQVKDICGIMPPTHDWRPNA
ncbi:MAG: hypothetical protein MJK04_34875 [Psychrosphaera sp.]|nr:hypothetical protein [Psychrosphaera sp.]